MVVLLDDDALAIIELPRAEKNTKRY
jgi:hypothetical protein